MTRIELRDRTKAILASPLTRAVLQVALALLLRYLRSWAHPAAKLVRRMVVAASAAERATSATAWIQKELPKIERELRKLKKTYPEAEYLLVITGKLRRGWKG